MYYYFANSVVLKTEHPQSIIGEEITKDEYDAIMDAISNPPVAPEGYYYTITKDCKWILHEQEHPQPEPDA